MNSILKPKPSDDPHDIVVVAPDMVRVAPVDEEVASPTPDVVRVSSEPQLHVGSDFSAGITVPPVDTTFRATAVNEVTDVNDVPDVNDVLVGGRRRSLAMRALRGVAALLLAACIGGVAMAWHYHAEATQRIIAEWAPLFAGKSSQPSEKTGLASPSVLAAAAEADTPNAAPQAPTAAEIAVPAAASPGEPQSLETQSLKTMARDLASANQEIVQLKASVEQLKASQQQLVAMVSEKAAAQNLRPKKPSPPPRPVAALAPPVRPPASALPPRPLRPAAAPITPSAAAAPLSPATAPYVPRQVEPPSRAAAESLTDPELTSVPRPPLPLR